MMRLPWADTTTVDDIVHGEVRGRVDRLIAVEPRERFTNPGCAQHVRHHARPRANSAACPAFGSPYDTHRDELDAVQKELQSGDLIALEFSDLNCNRDMFIVQDKRRVLPILHYALKPDGVLFLGSSENIGPFTELFELVDGKQRIFKKRPGGTALPMDFGPASVLPAPP